MNVQDNLRVALIICLIFTVAFSMVPEQYQAKNYDWLAHFHKARGQMRGGGDDRDLLTYPPLGHMVGSVFTFREEHFYFYLLMLIGIVTPMLVFFLSGRNWVSVLLYFTATSYFYFMEGGLVPQAFVGILLLIAILVKDWRVRAVLIPLSVLTHSVGLQAMGLTLIVLFIFENKLYTLLPFFPGCSGYFGNNRPDAILDAQIVPATSPASRSLRVSYFLRLIVDIFPLPFLLIAVKELKNRPKLLALVVLYLLLGLAHYRIFFFAPLVGIPGLVMFYEKLTSKNRLLFLGFSLLYGILQVYWWASYKLNCYPLV